MMFRARRTLPIALLLAALCACDPSDPSEADLTVAREIRPVIRGRSGPNGAPQWRAVLVPGRLLLDSPTSAGWYAIALPPPREEAASRRLTFANDRIILVMELGACAIAEYREALPNRAVLHWDGGRFEGCNGRGQLPAEIAGTTWELVRIRGEMAPEGRSPAATLQFGANGSLGGTLACNDGGIRTIWTANGGFVAGGPGFEQTAIGCNDPAVEAFGSRFWQAMISARSWHRFQHRLRITFADGTGAELRYLL